MPKSIFETYTKHITEASSVINEANAIIKLKNNTKIAEYILSLDFSEVNSVIKEWTSFTSVASNPSHFGNPDPKKLGLELIAFIQRKVDEEFGVVLDKKALTQKNMRGIQFNYEEAQDKNFLWDCILYAQDSKYPLGGEYYDADQIDLIGYAYGYGTGSKAGKASQIPEKPSPKEFGESFAKLGEYGPKAFHSDKVAKQAADFYKKKEISFDTQTQQFYINSASAFEFITHYLEEDSGEFELVFTIAFKHE